MAAGFDDENSTSYNPIDKRGWVSNTDGQAVCDDMDYVSVGEYDPGVPVTRCRYCPHCKMFFNAKNRYCPKCCYDSFSNLQRLMEYLEMKRGHRHIERPHSFRAVPMKKVKKREREGKRLFELLELEEKVIKSD